MIEKDQTVRNNMYSDPTNGNDDGMRDNIDGSVIISLMISGTNTIEHYSPT
jgi:hypothetical protein